MEIKVYTNNKNKVEMIACGEKIYEKFANVDLKTFIGNSGITSSTRVVKDPYMEPNQFIGLDSNKDWVFSCLQCKSKTIYAGVGIMQKSKSIQDYQSQDDNSDMWEWDCTGGEDCNCNFCDKENEP